MNQVVIKLEEAGINAEVEFLNNPTANKILECLPIESKAETWGDEIYFDINVSAPVQNATTDVDVGDVAYWPEGQCLCIFFGKTPASSADKPVAASEVVVVGKTAVKPELLRKVKNGSNVKVEQEGIRN